MTDRLNRNHASVVGEGDIIICIDAAPRRKGRQVPLTEGAAYLVRGVSFTGNAVSGFGVIGDGGMVETFSWRRFATQKEIDMGLPDYKAPGHDAAIRRVFKTEADPTGKSPHEAGAKVDAGKVRMHLITGGMSRAIMEVAKIGTFGAAKYTDGGWVSVPDGFRRYEDAQQRHAAYRHMGEVFDPESKHLHLAHEAWNALAKLDLYLREQEKKQDAGPYLQTR